MRNRLFKLTVGISISLCLIFTITWITSYFHRISLAHQIKYDTISLTINRGKTQVLWSAWRPLAPGEKMDPNPRFFGTIDWPEIGVLGVYVPRVKDPTHFRGTNAILTFPAWFLTLLLILPPLGWMLSRRKRKPQPNHCRVCDYDLRATPDRCPECGNPARFLLLCFDWRAFRQESPRRCQRHLHKNHPKRSRKGAKAQKIQSKQQLCMHSLRFAPLRELLIEPSNGIQVSR